MSATSDLGFTHPKVSFSASPLRQTPLGLTFPQSPIPFCSFLKINSFSCKELDETRARPLVCTSVQCEVTKHWICVLPCVYQCDSPKSMMPFTSETLLRSWPQQTRIGQSFWLHGTAEDPDRQSNLFKVIGLLTKNF